MIQNQRMSQELEFAGRIQASFLPREVPEMPGWELAATLVPARQTSGDFYDFVGLGDGRIALIVADVADKGVGAALYMALSRTLLRTYAGQYPDAPERVLQAANERILADAESDQFVTVFYGVLATQTGRLTYANAGHNPAFLLSGNGLGQPLSLPQTGVPLGMYANMTWRRQVVQLATGDLLVAYSDGVTEAQNGAGEEFGEGRLLKVLQGDDGRTASQSTTHILNAIQAFVADAPQFDDITLLLARRCDQ
jgi:serine phosphatase RsbU (regulator of sigma subunit)